MPLGRAHTQNQTVSLGKNNPVLVQAPRLPVLTEWWFLSAFGSPIIEHVLLAEGVGEEENTFFFYVVYKLCVWRGRGEGGWDSMWRKIECERERERERGRGRRAVSGESFASNTVVKEE